LDEFRQDIGSKVAERQRVLNGLDQIFFNSSPNPNPNPSPNPNPNCRSSRASNACQLVMKEEKDEEEKEEAVTAERRRKR